MKVQCPSCSTEFAVSLAAQIPEEQRLIMEIKKEDGFMCAGTLGGVITDMEKALQATAKSMGDRVSVFVSAMNAHPTGASIEFLVVPNKTRIKKRAPKED